MKISLPYKKITVEVICCLYILLFVYAAISKLLDFEHFRNQLGQSPLLTAFASIFAWTVPVLEIIIAILLSIRKTRLLALYLCFCLMIMFSVYIIIILTLSSFTPCSCGGILEKLGWGEHLAFNMVFVGLSVLAILFEKAVTTDRIPRLMLNLGVLGSVSIVSVYLMFLFSEHKVHRNNAFVRRYPHHPVEDAYGYKLPYNSYYLSGYHNGTIYLGNKTAPLHVASIDTDLRSFKKQIIKVDRPEDYGFTALNLTVVWPDFFLSDGILPAVLQGSLSSLKVSRGIKDIPGFSKVQYISKDSFIYRGISRDGRYQLGKFDAGSGITTNDRLLEKQLDGLFDSDGALLYNSTLGYIIYVYHYRNEFVVANTVLNSVYNGKTIDTVRVAQLKFNYEGGLKTTKLAHPPKRIQLHSCTSGNYLFIKSDRLGMYEPERMLKDASIIDVYDLKKRTYEFSFYLYDFKNEKIKSFEVYENLLVGLTENYIVVNPLKKEYFHLPDQ